MTRLRRTTAAVAALSLAVAGCASTAGPPAGAAPQSLRLSTYRSADLVPGAPPRPAQTWGVPGSLGPEALSGAQCIASNDRGSWTFVAPGAVDVLRSAAPLRVTCRREGYRDASVELRCVTPRAEGAAGGAYALFQAAALAGPGAVVLVPAGVIVGVLAGAMAVGAAAGSVAAEAVPEPDICAYGAGREVQVYMDPAR